MNRKLGCVRLSLTYAGCMLGAGFVSGQELWQYFSAYGTQGILGLILSIILLGAMTVLVVYLGLRDNLRTMDELVVRREIPWLRTVVGAAMAFLLFGIGSIMLAGISALGRQMLSVPAYASAAAITILAGLFAYFGFDGMIAVFSAAVPVLVAASVAVSCIQIGHTGFQAVQFSGGATNPMLGGWLFSCVNYAALNFYGTMSVLPPLAKQFTGKRTLLRGVAMGSVFLLMVAGGIVCALSTKPASIQTELPMCDVASGISPVCGMLYAALLFLAMFGNAVSSFAAIMHYLETKSQFMRRRRLPVLCVLLAMACAASLTGFRNLISFIYPIYGYVGIAVMLVVLWNTLHKK